MTWHGVKQHREHKEVAEHCIADRERDGGGRK
jgi:hypothetical protein